MYTYEMNAGYSVMDESLCMTVPAILDCFQDAAIFESENGRINVEYLYSRHIAWILSSWQIVIDRRPRLNERIRISTAPYDFTNYVGFRNFCVFGEDGKLIVRGASIWTLIDTEKLCPIRLTQELQESYTFEPKLEMDYAPRKIVLLGDANVQDQFRVRKFQIDSNRHMNNVEYVRYAMETLPEGTAFKELRVEYKKPARYDDEVLIAVIQAEGKHQVVMRDQEGALYAVVEFTLEEDAR